MPDSEYDLVWKAALSAERLKHLKDTGVNLDAAEPRGHGRSALASWAAAMPNVECVKNLLEAGASVHPLTIAAVRSNMAAMPAQADTLRQIEALLVEREQRHEENERRKKEEHKIQELRRNAKQCIMCGQELGFLDKLRGKASHKTCVAFTPPPTGHVRPEIPRGTALRTMDLPKAGSFGEMLAALAARFKVKSEWGLDNYWVSIEELCEIAERYSDLMTIAYGHCSCGDSNDMCAVTLTEKTPPGTTSVCFTGFCECTPESDYARLEELKAVQPEYAHALQDIADIHGRYLLSFCGREDETHDGEVLTPAGLRSRLLQRKDEFRSKPDFHGTVGDRGLLNEPYCSKTCLAKGAKRVFAASEGTTLGFSSRCATCGSATNTRECYAIVDPAKTDTRIARLDYGNHWCMAVPRKGHIVTYCMDCVRSGKSRADSDSQTECAWCGFPVQ